MGNYLVVETFGQGVLPEEVWGIQRASLRIQFIPQFMQARFGLEDSVGHAS